MSRRAWLPHPPRTIRPPSACPSGLPRYTSVAAARDALNHGLAATGLTAVDCAVCKGAHLTAR